MTSELTAFLGMDCGGTSAEWVVLSATGATLASGRFSGLQAARCSPEAAARELDRQILAAGRALPQGVRPRRALCGMAGAGAAETRARIARELRVDLEVTITTDIVVAAASALMDGPGVLVHAGTGSFAVARDRRGKLHRVGGRGPIVSDEGSAFDVGLEAVRAVVRAADRGLAPPAFQAALLEACGAASAERLGEKILGTDPARIAAVFPLVAAAAREADATARAILERAAGRLGELAAAAAERADLPADQVEVAMGGGTLQDPDHAESARRAILAAGFAGVRPAPRRPAFGAAELARALDRGEPPFTSWVEDDGDA